jgi:hypothetical protein
MANVSSLSGFKEPSLALSSNGRSKPLMVLGSIVLHFYRYSFMVFSMVPISECGNWWSETGRFSAHDGWGEGDEV